MKKLLVLTTVAISACSTPTPPQSAARTTVQAQTVSSTEAGARAQASASPKEEAAPAELSLDVLNGMTFSCSKAGLNAAAREAAKAPGRGRYQFSYFRLVSSSHHSTYEVHFKSNNYEDPDLKYCVSVYCQQGWNPKNANPSVSLMSNAARPARARAAGAERVEECGEHETHVERRMKR